MHTVALKRSEYRIRGRKKAMMILRLLPMRYLHSKCVRCSVWHTEAWRMARIWWMQQDSTLTVSKLPLERSAGKLTIF